MVYNVVNDLKCDYYYVSRPIMGYLSTTTEYDIDAQTFTYTNQIATMGWFVYKALEIVFTSDY